MRIKRPDVLMSTEKGSMGLHVMTTSMANKEDKHSFTIQSVCSLRLQVLETPNQKYA